MTTAQSVFRRVALCALLGLSALGITGCHPNHKPIVSPPQIDSVSDDAAAYNRYDAARIREQTDIAGKRNPKAIDAQQADLHEKRTDASDAQPRAAAINEALTRKTQNPVAQPLSPHQESVHDQLYRQPSEQGLRKAEMGSRAAR